MNVCVMIRFEAPAAEDWAAMRSLARRLTDAPDSVDVRDGDEPGWLVTTFTMPREAQYSAVDKIDRALKFSDIRRLDSIISFPKSAAERASAQRKAERRRARRRKT